jgi:hypothetical protein
MQGLCGKAPLGYCRHSFFFTDWTWKDTPGDKLITANLWRMVYRHFFGMSPEILPGISGLKLKPLLKQVLLKVHYSKLFHGGRATWAGKERRGLLTLFCMESDGVWAGNGHFPQSSQTYFLCRHHIHAGVLAAPSGLRFYLSR